MCGGHCLKTCSKTLAFIAKSSGEAELYAVVKGAAEALGMATLAQDLGRKVGIQLHIDALAAKGMIERKGLSKVRHLDVNILWLQEQCARKVLPITKVPGEDNIADLMTKHLGAAKIKNNIDMMNMTFSDGRASKAAQLHLVQVVDPKELREQIKHPVDHYQGLALWDIMGDRLVDRRGGDFWKARGEGGVWNRIHTKPSRTLFTPYKVAKGQTNNEKLNNIRFTKGVTQSGREFEFHDDWQKSENSHRILDEQWVGCTTFISVDKSNLLALDSGPATSTKRAPGELRWSDILFE